MSEILDCMLPFRLIRVKRCGKSDKLLCTVCRELYECEAHRAS